MAGLRLYLFGPPRLERDGQPVDINLRRSLGLLAYLAVTDRPSSRDALASLLWPDCDEREGRTRLRRTLHRLGQAVGGEIISAEGDRLRLAPSADVWVDVRAFAAAARAGLNPAGQHAEADQARISHLESAADLYRDDFLAGYSVPDSETWDEWQFFEREQLRQTCANVLATLTQVHRERQVWDAAIATARRWLALDHLHEPAHRALIELLALSGQHGAALRQYRECARILEAELGVEPAAETRTLYEAVRTRRLAESVSGSRPFGTPVGHLTADRATAGPLSPPPAVVSLTRASRPVGRDTELARLQCALEAAGRGQRQIVFITGEAGKGKSALVDAFLGELASIPAGMSAWIAVGHCLEQHGTGEPYMPVFEALSRLCQNPDGEPLVALLARYAPTWLVEMPWLVSEAELERLRSRVVGSTRERMLRELSEMLDIVARGQLFVLVLEDLHWADPSTLELLSRLARLPAPAQLLVIGTYRPADAQSRDNPVHAVAQELRARGLGSEIVLSFLTTAMIREYLAVRFPNADFPDELADLVYRSTEGSPLFMVNLLEWWIHRGLLVEEEGRWRVHASLEELERAVPETLRQLIVQQFEQLDPRDQLVLEVASVAGVEPTSAAVAAGAELDEDQVEERCDRLARLGQFLQQRGAAEWTDGTVTARFGFIHALHQQVLYGRVPPGRRARLHRRIGARLAAGAGARARLIAAELAMHFRRGRDDVQAVHYLQLAAEQALHRSAHREAVEHLSAALDLVGSLDVSPTERARRELSVLTLLGSALVVTEGWGSNGAEQAYARASKLVEQCQDPQQGSRASFCLAAMYEYRGEYRKTQELMEQRLPAWEVQEDELLIESYDLLACSLFHQGAFEGALDLAEQGLRRHDPSKQYTYLASFGEDPGVQCHGWAARSLWFLGYPDQALERAHRGLELAQGHLYSVVSAQLQLALVHQCRAEPKLTRRWAESAVALGSSQGFTYHVASATILAGWARAALGEADDGIAEILQGLGSCRSSGAMIDYPHFLALLAAACLRGGRVSQGLDAVAEALSLLRDGISFFYQAELHRLHGDLLVANGCSIQAESSYLRAIEGARQLHARSLELRATVSLARLWQGQPRERDALAWVRDVYDRFSEGLDTPDLRAARMLLDDLPAGPAQGA